MAATWRARARSSRRILSSRSSEAPAASVVFPRLLGLADATSFVRRLLDDHGVAVAPGHFFDLPAHFRLSLAGRPETLERGLERLAAALE